MYFKLVKMFSTLLVVFSIILATVALAQHDPGRNAVRLLAKGEVDTALVVVNIPPNERNSPINKAEKYYVKTMAACIRGENAAMLENAQSALEQGLPVERFLAGPRDVFAPLYALNEFKELAKEIDDPLLHGPMLGTVSDMSASFWMRTVDEAEVRVEATNTSNGDSKTGTGHTSAGADYTAIVTISGLQPETNYQYKVWVDGVEIDKTANFQSFPKTREPSQFSIAFGGGAGFTAMHEYMWTTIAGHRPDALLLLGDNVYIDDPEHRLTQRYCYYRRQSQPEWRSLIAKTPVFTIYDDHDFGMDDCIPGAEIETPSWKREVVEVFRQNWNNPGYGGGEVNPGCWYDFYIGDVHFIMLDCRYYRDLKEGSMLGSFQKNWLFETLKSSKGTFKVLASSVPWSPGIKPGSKDPWDGYPEEREEIFSFIETNDIDGVLLMAADRHRSDMRKIKRPNGYNLYEVMSSRLTNVHTHDLVEDAVGSEFIMGYNKTCSFGLLEFDTTADDPTVKYSIVSIDDEVVDSRTLKLSQLSFGDAR